MKIEVLYFDGCPNYRVALERVREVLREEGVQAELVEVNIPDEQAARALGFLGSPTIRVNGLDVEPAARGRQDYGMMCRAYWDGTKPEGAPPKEWIRAAIREALEAQPSAQDCCEPSMSSRRQPPANSKRPTLLVAGSIVAAAFGQLLLHPADRVCVDRTDRGRGCGGVRCLASLPARRRFWSSGTRLLFRLPDAKGTLRFCVSLRRSGVAATCSDCAVAGCRFGRRPGRFSLLFRAGSGVSAVGQPIAMAFNEAGGIEFENREPGDRGYGLPGVRDGDPKQAGRRPGSAARQRIVRAPRGRDRV